MEALLFIPGAPPALMEAARAVLPAQGFLWLDFHHSETDWPVVAERVTGVRFHERHVRDSFNLAHPSFYDSTADYDMVVFRSHMPEAAEAFFTHPSTFFLLDRALITVRPAGSRSVESVHQRLLAQPMRIPVDPAGLMHLILNAMVDRFLALREPLAARMESWASEMLDPRNAEDLRSIMEHRSTLRRLEALAEEQEEAITAWRDNTLVAMDEQLAVRYTDLVEHIRRVTRFASHQQMEVENLIQLHFSAVSTRTNEIMRTLTVVSAIFLPLNLLAGIFGMNFEYMPELQMRAGYYLTLGGMVLLAVILLMLFRSKRWF
ncbi:MAG: magnesium transporter CorA family protein [Thiohalomonadaceae bacterium]